jgi:hypothetical protein
MPRATVGALSASLVLVAPAAAKLRPIPDTSAQIRVWNDQYSLPLSSAQVNFLARDNAGTQNIPPAEADRFRRVNPDFLVLTTGSGSAAALRAGGPIGQSEILGGGVAGERRHRPEVRRGARD